MKGTARGQCCRLSAKHSISFAFHFAISCSGHRGHPGHRVFFGAVSHSAVPLRRDRLCTTKATHELQEFPVYTPQGCKRPFLCDISHALVARTRRAQLKVENGRLYMTKSTRKLQELTIGCRCSFSFAAVTRITSQLNTVRPFKKPGRCGELHPPASIAAGIRSFHLLCAECEQSAPRSSAGTCRSA